MGQKKGDIVTRANNATHLKGFLINRVLQHAASISKDAVKSYGKGRKVRALRKLPVCENIVNWKMEYNQNPNLEPTDADTLRPARFNAL